MLSRCGWAGFHRTTTANAFKSLWLLSYKCWLWYVTRIEQMFIRIICISEYLFTWSFEINLRVSTTCKAKHMSIILNLIQCMEMFIRIRGTSVCHGTDYWHNLLCLLKSSCSHEQLYAALLRVQSLKSLLCLRRMRLLIVFTIKYRNKWTKYINILL